MSTHPAQEPLTMPSRSLGPDHLTVSPIGVGCMGMTWAYGKTDRSESIATIHRALDLGVTLFDTADIYGPLVNEELVGEALAGAWVLAQGEHVVAIPGASKRKHLEENLGGAFVQLTEEELTWLDQVPAAIGGRY
jgi:aryl-alcohol dehydrogenase-like predicted oxidoreductase